MLYNGGTISCEGGADMNNIRLYREKKLISQVELAKAVGVKQQAVSKWESGNGYPSSKRLALVAKALSCDVSDLLREEA